MIKPWQMGWMLLSQKEQQLAQDINRWTERTVVDVLDIVLIVDFAIMNMMVSNDSIR